MYYIENVCHDPRFNLALEEYVLSNKCVREPVLLLWQNEPSVIIGRYQNTPEEINPSFIEERGIHVVRRITGGGAVYHDLGNLNYSFMIPNASGSIEFESFTRPVITALGRLGIKAELSGRNDLLVEGRKFSGNAQHYQGGKLLHHGTILFDSNLDDVQKALHVREDKFVSKGIKSVRSRVTNLKPFLPVDMSVEEFREFLLKDFDLEYLITEMELTDAEYDGIRALADGKYDSWEWNYGKSPLSSVSARIRTAGGTIESKISVESGYIRDMRLTGDFFCMKDIRGFEAAFVGCRYSPDAVRDVLLRTPVEQYICNISTKDMETLFC